MPAGFEIGILWHIGFLSGERYPWGRGRQTISNPEQKFPDLLVVGATGRIGTLLRRHWRETGPVDAVRWQGRRPGPGLHVVDPLADPGALAQAARGRAVILCLAGVVAGRAAREGDLADNTALAEAAVEAGAASGARVILTSSAAVYGARGGLCREEDAPTPMTGYGRAKAEMEARGAALGARLGVGVTSLRIGNVAGSDAILGGWHPGFRLDRFADGRTPRRSYIGPATLARVLGALVARDDLPGLINVAAPGAVEMGALLDIAGLGWTPRPAPADAIEEVRLATDRLAGLVALPARAGTAAAIVAEWRAEAGGAR